MRQTLEYLFGQEDVLLFYATVLVSLHQQGLLRANWWFNNVVICTGCMELLDQKIVLNEISKVTLPGGELWVSSQVNTESLGNPTSHLNLKGITKDMAISFLRQAGFCHVISV